MGIELIFPRDLGKRAYRLKCRFATEPRPTKERLKAAALVAMEMFVRDMRQQGFEHLTGEMPRMSGPFSPVKPVTLRRPKVLSAREMLPAVARGARFLPGRETIAQDVAPLHKCESWEYGLELVFVSNVLRLEVPDRHEEKVGSR